MVGVGGRPAYTAVFNLCHCSHPIQHSRLCYEVSLSAFSSAADRLLSAPASLPTDEARLAALAEAWGCYVQVGSTTRSRMAATGRPPSLSD